MNRIVLHLKNSSVIVEDLKEVWIQPSIFCKEWILCYRDVHYLRKVVYASSDKNLLKYMGRELLNAYATGCQEIAIR